MLVALALAAFAVGVATEELVDGDIVPGFSLLAIAAAVVAIWVLERERG